MKYKFHQLLILIFVPIFLLTCPAYSEDQSATKSRSQTFDLAGYSSLHSSFLEFYRNQAGVLHSNIQKLFEKTGLDEFLFKQMIITSDIQDGRYPSALPSHSSYQKNLGSLMIKPADLNDRSEPTLYARMSQHLRSPILAPYKYKTATNTLLSVIVPIAATDHLTIIPIVSYTFSINGSDRTDFRSKALPADRESPVIYGGINLSYTF